MALVLWGRNGYIQHIFTYSPTLQYKLCLLCVNQRRKKGECVEEMTRNILESLHLSEYATQSFNSQGKKKVLPF